MSSEGSVIAGMRHSCCLPALQIDASMAELKSNVFGNPHSPAPSSVRTELKVKLLLPSITPRKHLAIKAPASVCRWRA